MKLIDKLEFVLEISNMIYYLNQDTVPTIPTPHDCIIKKVTIRGDFIIFEFEDDISYHDSIRHSNPDAKSLVIKIHLVDDFDTYKMKYYKKPWCRGVHSRIDNAQLEKIAKMKDSNIFTIMLAVNLLLSSCLAKLISLLT